MIQATAAGIVHFTVVCLVAKPFNRNKDRVGLVIIKHSCFSKIM